jgi:hypothetical protein
VNQTSMPSRRTSAAIGSAEPIDANPNDVAAGSTTISCCHPTPGRIHTPRAAAAGDATMTTSISVRDDRPSSSPSTNVPVPPRKRSLADARLIATRTVRVR